MGQDPNLRPYYDPQTFNAGYSVVFKPGIGLIDTNLDKPITSTLSTTSTSNLSNSLAKPNLGIGFKNTLIKKNVNKVLDQEKNIYSDLDLLEYFDYHNITELVKNLISSFIKNYFKVLMSQPIEIVRLLLQVGIFEDDHKNSLITASKNNILSSTKIPTISVAVTQPPLEESDQSDEEINYFLSANESTPKKPRRRSIIIETRPPPSPLKHSSSDETSNVIEPLSNHTLDIMSALLTKEGVKGLWRGINASFIYNTFSSTIEAWITGFLSPFLQIPDPFFLDVTHSPDPRKSLMLSIGATVITSLILAPLDLIRTKLILTSFKSSSERSIRESFKNLKHLYCPMNLVIPTILHSFSSVIFRKGTPYLLFIKFNIDSYSSPVLYSTTNFISSFLELFLKLPTEAILRNIQINYLLDQEKGDESLTITDEDMIIKYNKINFWEIEPKHLFNGWRVGIMNVIGFWGLRILKSNNDVKEEKL